MDTIGLNDSEFDFTNDEIFEKIVTNLIRNDKFPHKIRSFIVFQSLQEGTINIKQSHINLKRNFF